MKKTINYKDRILVLLLCIIPLYSHAQHLKFMGVPINGTINNFQKKLQYKGFSISKYNKGLSAGVRDFDGYFANKKASVIVFYNTRTKTVYKCRVAFDSYESESSAIPDYSYFKELLSDKYNSHSLNSDMVKDSTRAPYSYSWAVIQPPVEIGSLLLGYIEISIESYNNLLKYMIWIDYIDSTNNELNDKDKMNDL